MREKNRLTCPFCGEVNLVPVWHEDFVCRACGARYEGDGFGSWIIAEWDDPLAELLSTDQVATDYNPYYNFPKVFRGRFKPRQWQWWLKR
jgi:hypothetical protein